MGAHQHRPDRLHRHPAGAVLEQGTRCEAAAKALKLGHRSSRGTSTGRPRRASSSTEHAAGRAEVGRGRWTVTALHAAGRFPRGRAWLPRAGHHARRRSAGDRRAAGQGPDLLALAPGLPWSWGSAFGWPRAATPLEAGRSTRARLARAGARMALAALDAPAAVALPAWTAAAELAAFIADPAKARPPAERRPSKPGETINAALAVPFRARARANRARVTFALAWHFPNVQRFQHCGQSLQPPLARRHGRRRATWRRTSRPSGNGRSSITTRSTSRTCRRNSSTPSPRRA